ncbi:MAG: pectinesterase family protein [Candidatus Pedobacter colombiensis]|uniref:Pectinesterase n=1 Tax=Candidatus Pedobacter colombiensis TaxID=3121371 RepID=A0AAJ5W9B1_9SPHI|nr:pectinesterase family protein [Pedobacter sp.]WEK20289.1 MAG: pectinesterase family protein [Pedobacter sp.]
MKRLLLCLTCLLYFYTAFAQKADFVVAKDGSGNFKTIQEAINAVPDFKNTTTTIFIKNGVYKEKLNLSAAKRKVRMLGESTDKTILTYDDYAQKKDSLGKDIGTTGSSSFFIYGDDFTAENITFENSAGPVGQAVALWIAGDKARFLNCKMLGFQDTLYTYGKGSRQYFYKCYISGTVDFIFGSATVIFDKCEIFCKKPGYVTAASTPDTTKYGYVFMSCKINGSAPDGSVYLGRPWRPAAKTVFLNCELGAVIKAEGWHNWGKESNEKTAFYAEYKSKGIGAQPEKRVSWSHQLSDQEAKEYTVTQIFKGWQPVQ